MSGWQVGAAEIDELLADRSLQQVTGTAADGGPGLARAHQTFTSAQVLLANDPANAFVLAYDAAPTAGGGHVAVERAVRAQFGAVFVAYGGLRRRRNEIEYPSHPDEAVAHDEAAAALDAVEAIMSAAEQLLPHLTLFRA